MDDNKESKKHKKQKERNWELLKQGLKTLLYFQIYGFASTRVGPGLVCFIARKLGYNLNPALH
jgi:hypothetical protein